jgi:hypothetical protein
MTTLVHQQQDTTEPHKVGAVDKVTNPKKTRRPRKTVGKVKNNTETQPTANLSNNNNITNNVNITNNIPTTVNTNIKSEPPPEPIDSTHEIEQRKRRIRKQITEADAIHEQILKIILTKNPSLPYSDNGKEIFIRQTYVDDETYMKIDEILNIYIQNKKYQIERNMATMNT